MEQYQRGELTFDVIDAGPADGPVVVLLHGFPQFNTSWNAVIDRLTAQGYRCLAPNQRGYSAGARPPRRRDYRLPEIAEDIRALIDSSGAERVHLVGHDWGAAAGKLRIEHRQASLEELGRLADPPMTKDAVAGRIRRLLSMADRKAKQDGIPDTESAVTPDLLEDA